MMNKKKVFSVLLIFSMIFSIMPWDMMRVQVQAEQTTSMADEEDEEYLRAKGSVIAQYSLGTKAVTYLEVSVQEAQGRYYGVVINGRKYASTGNEINGKFLVKLENLTADTDYVAYPYVDDLIAEDGIAFTTAAQTTSIGNNSGYYSLEAGGISYSLKNNNGKVDIQGANKTKTTYSHSGWDMTNSNRYVQLYAVPTIVTGVSGSEYIRLTYVARNNSAYPIANYRFGISCDSMIAYNDYAPVYTTSYGMRVAESAHPTALAFAVITQSSNAADGLGRMVTNVSSQWYGRYDLRSRYVYTQGSTDDLLNTDSGMALSWQNVYLQPGETKVFSVIFGVADSSVLSKEYEKLSSPVVTDKTYNSITIDTVAGQTYSIETTAGLVASYYAEEDGSYTFEGLRGGTEYNVYTEVVGQDDEELKVIPSDNTVVTTDDEPAFKTAVESVAAYKMAIGEKLTTATLLERKVTPVKGNMRILEAEFVNPEDAQYIKLLASGTQLSAKKVTPDNYKVALKLKVAQFNSEAWGEAVEINDIVFRVRVTESEVPYVTKEGTTITIHDSVYHALKNVKYSFTGEEVKEYTSWYDFHSFGKSSDQLKAVNGASGYKNVPGTVTELGADEDGELMYSSTLTNATIKLPAVGNYTFLLTDQAGKQYTQYVDVTEEDWAVGKPSITKDANNINLVNNDSGLYKVNYIYTGDEEYKYTTWGAFVAKGKTNTSVNTATGYKLVKADNTGTTESKLDGTAINLTKAGWYTFVLTFDNGKSQIAYTVYISEEDALANTPYITYDETTNAVSFVDNNSQLRKVTYQYSGQDDSYNYTSWYSFTQNGKKFKDMNGASGYTSIVGSVTDGVSSLDGRKLYLMNPGWYNILMYYNVGGKETVAAYKANATKEFDAVSVSTDGFMVKYEDALADGNITEYSYQYLGNDKTEVDYTTFTADKTEKVDVARTNDGVSFNFIVSRAGTYLVQVKDSVLGTKYYTVEVAEPEVVTDQTANVDFPYLNIDETKITATSPNADVLFVRIGTDTEFIAGNELTVDNSGIYTVQVYTDDGVLYELAANVSTISHALVETDALETAIAQAERFLAGSGYVEVEDTEAQTEPGSYISNASVATFKDAIASAKQSLAEKKSQAAVDAARKTLNNALSAYKAQSRRIDANLVTVQGSTITIAPVKDTDKLTKLYYNTVEDNITAVVAGNWSQLNSNPYKKITTFADGKYVIENAENGIYSFLISVKENGVNHEYYQYAVVAADSTGVETAKAQLNEDYYGQLEDLLVSLKKESDAITGDQYVSDDVYNRLANAFGKAKTMLKRTDYTANSVEDEFIPFFVDLNTIIAAAKKGVSVKEDETEEKPVVEITKAEIAVVNAENAKSAKVTFTSPDLKSIHVAYGTHTTWSGIVKAGDNKVTPKAGVGAFTAKMNGEYTALISYTDGTEEFQYFTVSDVIYPFTVTDNDGKIAITLEDYSALELVSYGYGDTYNAYSDAGLLYYNAENLADVTTADKALSLAAMGNGVHTIFLKFNNGLTYKVDVDVTTVTKPAVIEYKGNFAAYANGFDVKTAAYAAGTYTNWADMYESACYISLGSWIDSSELAAGPYTFGFTTTNGTEYMVVVTVE